MTQGAASEGFLAFAVRAFGRSSARPFVLGLGIFLGMTAVLSPGAKKVDDKHEKH